MANTYLAIESGLELIPCLNKVDLPGAEPERVAAEVADLIGEPADEVRQDQRQDRRGRERGARRADRPGAAAAGRSGPAAAGAHLRLRVRPVPGGDRLHPRGRRDVHQGGGDPRHAGRHRGRDRRHRLLHAEDDLGRPTRCGRGRLPHHRDQGRDEAPRRRHADHCAPTRRPSRCPATARSSRWCSAACSRSTPTTTRTCATRWRSCRSTTPRCPGSRRPPTRSASASAAASSACCTWTSSASASSASTTSSC